MTSRIQRIVIGRSLAVLSTRLASFCPYVQSSATQRKRAHSGGLARGAGTILTKEVNRHRQKLSSANEMENRTLMIESAHDHDVCHGTISARAEPSRGGCTPDLIHSSGGGLGIHQPRSTDHVTPRRQGRARDRATCPAATRSNPHLRRLGPCHSSNRRKAGPQGLTEVGVSSAACAFSRSRSRLMYAVGTSQALGRGRGFNSRGGVEGHASGIAPTGNLVAVTDAAKHDRSAPVFGAGQRRKPVQIRASCTRGGAAELAGIKPGPRDSVSFKSFATKDGAEPSIERSSDAGAVPAGSTMGASFGMRADLRPRSSGRVWEPRSCGASLMGPKQDRRRLDDRSCTRSESDVTARQHNCERQSVRRSRTAPRGVRLEPGSGAPGNRSAHSISFCRVTGNTKHFAMEYARRSFLRPLTRKQESKFRTADADALRQLAQATILNTNSAGHLRRSCGSKSPTSTERRSAA